MKGAGQALFLTLHPEHGTEDRPMRRIQGEEGLDSQSPHRPFSDSCSNQHAEADFARVGGRLSEGAHGAQGIHWGTPFAASTPLINGSVSTWGKMSFAPFSRQVITPETPRHCSGEERRDVAAP